MNFKYGTTIEGKEDSIKDSDFVAVNEGMDEGGGSETPITEKSG